MSKKLYRKKWGNIHQWWNRFIFLIVLCLYWYSPWVFRTEKKLKYLEDFFSFIVLPFSGTVIKGLKILPHFSVRQAAQYKQPYGKGQERNTENAKETEATGNEEKQQKYHPL